MAVKHQVTPGGTALKTADNIGHLLLGGDNSVGKTFLIKGTVNIRGGLSSVSRRIWALRLDETAKEVDQSISVLINPAQEDLFLIGHENSLLLFEKFNPQMMLPLSSWFYGFSA
jgi:hypothetical protein